MCEASAYRIGKAIEMYEVTLAKNEENGASGMGHGILGHVDVSRIIIILSMWAGCILQTHFGSFFLITHLAYHPWT